MAAACAQQGVRQTDGTEYAFACCGERSQAAGLPENKLGPALRCRRTDGKTRAEGSCRGRSKRKGLGGQVGGQVAGVSLLLGETGSLGEAVLGGVCCSQGVMAKLGLL